MTLDIVGVVGGLVVLGLGGESLVRGAVGLSMRLRVTPAVIGLTVVSAGTSMPELMVSVVAALRDSPDVAVGNIIGSNIFNLALVLGVCAVAVPLPVLSKTRRWEWPFLVLATGASILLMRGEVIGRVEGAALLGALIVFVWYMVWRSRRDVEVEEAAVHTLGEEAPSGRPGLPRQTFLILLGMGLLFWGGQLVVSGATSLAAKAGISERVIGLTVVALATSLPELVSSLIAALRGRTDVAVGNVIGSSIFNLLGIFGVAGLLTGGLEVHPRFLSGDVWWMLAFTLMFGVLAIVRKKIGRIEGEVEGTLVGNQGRGPLRTGS